LTDIEKLYKVLLAMKDKKDILITLPTQIEEALRKEAQENERSRNAQLVFILKERYAASARPAQQGAQQRAA
jgi:hypothetical protein